MFKDSSLDRLPTGARIAVIGGGPAGSFFALFALHYARQAGLNLHVTLFEPRDFTRPGPKGCNMCAGLIPTRVLRELAEIGLVVPERIIRARIRQYTLHTAAGQIRLSPPDPEAGVISVYRGQGPPCAFPWPEPISFDGFLLEAARARGAEIILERVTAIALRPHPGVTTPRGTVPADLVVLATGVNCRTIHFTDLTYRPPPRQLMAQAELCSGGEALQAAPGGTVHVFLPGDGAFTFGTLVPKEPCLNVSLLGPELTSSSLDRFLELPEVMALLPDAPRRVCGCRPHIAVGAARPLYADRFVAVGDAGITRLYKNGIGTALRTARRAAETAIQQGVSASVFHAQYGPLCREIARDNWAGRFLFAFTHVFQHHRRLTLPHLGSIAAEQALAPGEQLHSRLLWGMFTGVYPYRELLGMALHPRLQARLFASFLSSFVPHPSPHAYLADISSREKSAV